MDSLVRNLPWDSATVQKGKTGEDLGVWLQRVLGFSEKSCHLEPKFLGSSWEPEAGPAVEPRRQSHCLRGTHSQGHGIQVPAERSARKAQKSSAVS